MTTKQKSAAMKFLEELAGPLTLGGLISSIRKGEGERLATFAKKLKISVSDLSDIEHDRKGVSPKRAARFAKILAYSEKQFIRLALQDSLNRQGLKKFHVKIEAA